MIYERTGITGIGVRKEVLAPRDVKNEDRPGYVHENKGIATNCTPLNSAFCTKMHPSSDNSPKSAGVLDLKCTACTILCGENAHGRGDGAERGSESHV